MKNRLVVGVVILSALGFIASDVAARSYLKSFLTTQVDKELASVAGGTSQRLVRSGIAPDENQTLERETSYAEKSEQKPKKSGKSRPAAVAIGPIAPLRQVPTSISVTLLNPKGNIVGILGGDPNTQQISRFLKGFTTPVVKARNNHPFTIKVPGLDFRVLTRVLPSNYGSVVVAQSMESVDKIVRQLQFLFILIGLIALLLIAFASRKVIDIGL